MKTFYKILFSICSTLVCTAHSFRAFAANSCWNSIYLPPGGVLRENVYGPQHDGECKRQFVGYVEMMANNLFAKVYTCTDCINANEELVDYELFVNSGTDIYGKYDQTAGGCTLQIKTCTNIACEKQLGSAKYSAVISGYAYYKPAGKTNCYWELDTKKVLCQDRYYQTGDEYAFISANGKTYVSNCDPCPNPASFGLSMQDGAWTTDVYKIVRANGDDIYGCMIAKENNLKDKTGDFKLETSCYY